MSFSYDFIWDYYPLFVASGYTTGDATSNNFSITVYPYWFKQITLEWVIPTDWGSCLFNVYKSQTENGPFIKLNPTPLSTSTNFFKDTTTQNFSKIYNSWYIVEAQLTNGKRIQSDPITWGKIRLPWVELHAQEIQRREWVLLNGFTGVETHVFRRRTYGPRCSNCWNFELEKATKDKCPICMGTTFEGGYFPPIKTLLQYEASPNEIQLTYFGKWEIDETMAWTIALPNLHQRDLLYRSTDGSLYEITERKETTLQAVTVRQIFKITELDRESPEFQVLLANNLIPARYQT